MRKYGLLDDNLRKEISNALKMSVHFIDLDRNLDKWIDKIDEGISKGYFIIPDGPLAELTHFASKEINQPMIEWFNAHGDAELARLYYGKFLKE